MFVNYFQRQRGSAIKTGQQILIYRAFQNYRNQNILRDEAIRKTAQELKFCPITVGKYVVRLEKGVLTSPGKTRKRNKFRKWNNFERDQILQAMQWLRARNELFKLSKLQTRLKDVNGKISLTSFISISSGK